MAERGGTRQAAETVEVTIPPKPEFLSVARLTIAAVAARQLFTYDEIEDLKIAVSEACTALILAGTAGHPLTLRFAMDADALEVAARAVAERAVDMFDRHIRDPIRAQATDEAEAADKLVAAFRELLPAVTALVSHHFRRVLLAVAEEHIERVGGEAEIAATRAESRRLREA